MKKITLIMLVFFVLSIIVPMAMPAKDTTPATVKKVVKKKDKGIVDPTVFIKENGKKFHKRNCKLVTDKTGIKLSEAEKKGYTPCSACFKSNLVYITENGKKFHKKDCKLVENTNSINKKLARLKGYKPCKACSPPEVKVKKEAKIKK